MQSSPASDSECGKIRSRESWAGLHQPGMIDRLNYFAATDLPTATNVAGTWPAEPALRVLWPLKWQDRISVNQNVCHGKPCIKGTRVLVSVVLAECHHRRAFRDHHERLPYRAGSHSGSLVLCGRPGSGSLRSASRGELKCYSRSTRTSMRGLLSCCDKPGTMQLASTKGKDTHCIASRPCRVRLNPSRYCFLKTSS
jgi:hypothetical protein